MVRRKKNTRDWQKQKLLVIGLKSVFNKKPEKWQVIFAIFSCFRTPSRHELKQNTLYIVIILRKYFVLI